MWKLLLGLAGLFALRATRHRGHGGRARRRATKHLLRRFAHAHQLDLDWDRHGRPEVRGRVDGVPMRVRSDAKGLEVRASSGSKGLSLRRARGAPASEDHAIGDPAFDAEVIVTGDRGLARTVLDAPTRTKVVELLRAGGRVDDGHVLLPLPDLPQRLEGLRWAANLTFHAARALGPPPGDATARLLLLAARDPEPGVRANAMLEAHRRAPDDPAVVEALDHALHTRGDPLRTGVAAWVRRREDVLLDLAHPDQDPLVIAGALRALSEGWAPEAWSRAVVSLCASPRPEAQAIALEHALRLPPAERSPALLAATEGLTEVAWNRASRAQRARLRRAVVALASAVLDASDDTSEHAVANLVEHADADLSRDALQLLAERGGRDAAARLHRIRDDLSRVSPRRRRIDDALEHIRARLDTSARGGVSLASTADRGGLSLGEAETVRGRLTRAEAARPDPERDR